MPWEQPKKWQKKKSEKKTLKDNRHSTMFWLYYITNCPSETSTNLPSPRNVSPCRFIYKNIPMTGVSYLVIVMIENQFIKIDLWCILGKAVIKLLWSIFYFRKQLFLLFFFCILSVYCFYLIFFPFYSCTCGIWNFPG